MMVIWFYLVEKPGICHEKRRNTVTSAKRLCFLAVALGAALSLLVGTAASRSNASGSLVIGQTTPPDTLDPQKSQNASSFIAWQLSYECLLRSDETGALRPLLATSYTQSPDGLTYDFTLRKGVRFQNGAPLTADDVVYTFDRLTKSGIPYAQARFPTLKNVTALTASKVEFTLTSPTAGFLLAMADPFTVGCAIMSRKADSENLASTMVGTGPFSVVSYTPLQKLVVKKFANYWGKKPKLSKITVFYMPDPSAQLVALTSGRVDMIFPDASLVRALKLSDKIKLGSVIGAYRTGFDFNVTSGPLADVNVRRAIELAIDKKAAVAGTDLGYGAASTFFPKPYKWAPPASAYQYVGKHDIAEAKRLLAAAGYPNGFKTTYIHWAGLSPRTDRFAQVLKSQLAVIGVDLQIDAVDTTTFLSRLSRADFGLALTNYVYYSDPLQYIRPRPGRNGPIPASVQNLVNAAQAAKTPAEYLQAIKALAIQEDNVAFPSVPVCSPTQFVAYTGKKVHGVKIDFSGSWLFLMKVTAS
jgi:ABC-type transport system substrate-binding protein